MAYFWDHESIGKDFTVLSKITLVTNSQIHYSKMLHDLRFSQKDIDESRRMYFLFVTISGILCPALLKIELIGGDQHPNFHKNLLVTDQSFQVFESLACMFLM